MQYLCSARGWVALALVSAAVAVNAEVGAIYRTVGPDGSVSYSDQPGPGAKRVPGLLIAPAGPAQSSRAQEQAQARIDRQLELAAELAAERRARSAQRESAALTRAELRESRAREQALQSQQEPSGFSDRYPYLLPQYPRHYPRHSQHRRGYHGPYRPDRPGPPGPDYDALPDEPVPARQSRPLPPD